MIGADENRTRNLLIWSQTRYHCATTPVELYTPHEYSCIYTCRLSLRSVFSRPAPCLLSLSLCLCQCASQQCCGAVLALAPAPALGLARLSVSR